LVKASSTITNAVMNSPVLIGASGQRTVRSRRF